MSERRRFTRVDFESRVIARGDGWTSTGRVADLSLHGAWIRTDDAVPLGAVVEVEIVLSEPLELSFTVESEVVRVQHGGFAVRFGLRGIPLDALEHLRLIVGTEYGDVEGVMDEFYTWLDEHASAVA